ncbi:hypothetical protein ACFGC5_10200 [Staphylococcus xylosus]|uniref:hypothetical protein n=1 Tax=Staphylococcus TaxID=1279 RepID=UPI001C3EA13F|nr:hypothetical protein [Staphylococcus nepalensis]
MKDEMINIPKWQLEKDKEYIEMIEDISFAYENDEDTQFYQNEKACFIRILQIKDAYETNGLWFHKYIDYVDLGDE